MALRITFSTARRSSSGSPSTSAGSRRVVFDRAAVRGGFDAGILHQLLHQLVQAHGIAPQRIGIAFGARDLQQLADQRIQAVRFLLDPVQGGVGIFAGAGQFHRHSEPGQRGTQLVRNIQQQAALGRQQRLDAVGHAVEGAGQLAQFVAARRAGARRKIAAAEPLHGLLQLAHRTGEVVRQPVAQQHRRGHHEDVFRRQEPRPDVGTRGDEEEPVAAVVGVAGDQGGAHADKRQRLASGRRGAPGRSGPGR